MNLYDQAITQYENALELDTHSVLANLSLGSAYIMKGEMDKGIRTLEWITNLYGPTPILQGSLGWAYAKAGRTSDAHQLLKELYSAVKKSHVPAIFFAEIHCGLEEIDQCFNWLEKAIDDQHPFILYIPINPIFDTIRSHPRYKALLRKMNLEP